MDIAGLRTIETQADIFALNFVSLGTVVRFNWHRGKGSRFGWMFCDHATEKGILKRVKK
jgi:hypothetical protein